MFNSRSWVNIKGKKYDSHTKKIDNKLLNKDILSNNNSINTLEYSDYELNNDSWINIKGNRYKKKLDIDNIYLNIEKLINHIIVSVKNDIIEYSDEVCIGKEVLI